MIDAQPIEVEIDLSAPTLEDTLQPTEMSDGADILVALDGIAPAPMAAQTDHYANLAEHLTDEARKSIANKIEEWVETDRQGRKEWEECLKDGMQTLGISPLSRDDRPFKGATTVTHPVILEAAVQFQSRAIEELFPSSGPVKAKTVPNPTPDILEQGDRVASFFNYYLTEVDEGYYDDSDQMLFILALHGHIFRKTYVDPITEMARGRYVTATDLVVPYTATSLIDADHYTHVYTMPLNDIKRAMKSGYFRNVVFKEGSFGSPERTEEKEMKDDADRREPVDISEDLPELYECHCDLILDGMDEGDGIALPYIVTMERNTSEVLCIKRNWSPNDSKRMKQVWFSSYKYLQGLGFYGLGLFHVLGNIAASCGALLRAIIDAGAFSNLQGGFVAKQGGGRKMDVELEMGVWKEIDLTPEELKTAFYTPPFKEPSQTLMLTLRMLLEAAQRFSSTTETMVGEGPRSGPVGTTLALIEQGSKVFTSIHKRMHRSLAGELKNLAKLFRLKGIEYPYDVGGASLQQDLDDRVDIMPVSDPTIVSNTQRIAMAQAAQQLVNGSPIYGPENKRMADLALLKVMKVPNAEEIVKDYPPPPPEPVDPITANMNMLNGKPVKAYPGEPHDAFISATLNFLQSLPPQGQKQVEPAAMAFIAEHAGLKYQEMMMQMSQQTGMDPNVLAAQMPIPPLVPQLTPPPPQGAPNGGQ